MNGPIIAAIDHTSRGPIVGDAARQLATATGSPLFALRVVRVPEDLPDAHLRFSRPEAEEHVLREGRARLGPLAEGIDAEAHVVGGPRWETICSFAKEHKASLVVIGGHAYSVLDRILGTTIARVVQHSPCSVLVARNRPPLLPPRRIVVGVHFGPGSEELLELAEHWASKLGSEDCRVTLVHVPRFPPERGAELDSSLPIAEALAKHGEEKLAEWSARLSSGRVDKTIVTKGKPWRVLTETVEEQKANLLIVGSHDTDLIDEIWGGAADRIVNSCPSSVLVVRTNAQNTDATSTERT